MKIEIQESCSALDTKVLVDGEPLSPQSELAAINAACNAVHRGVMDGEIPLSRLLEVLTPESEDFFPECGVCGNATRMAIYILPES